MGEFEEVKDERLRFPPGEGVGLRGGKQTPSRSQPIISLLHQGIAPNPKIVMQRIQECDLPSQILKAKSIMNEQI